MAHNFNHGSIITMAKTSFQLVPPEYLRDYNAALQSGDRFQFTRVRVKNVFFSRNRLKGLTQRSLIPAATILWNGLTSGVRTAWDNAAVFSNTTGWKLFLRDYAFRIKQGIPGLATPSNLYQVEVGNLHVQSPATGIKIAQFHPQTYYITRKVRGSRDMREPVLVVENFDLPLNISLSYKANLTSLGVGSFAKFYCVLYSHYQGRTIETLCQIPFTFVQDWIIASASITQVLGLIRGYTVFVEIFNARGDVWFDNLNIEHSGQNWARDQFCNDIDQSFTKAFAQVPKNWVAVDVSEGAFFGSVYYN